MKIVVIGTRGIPDIQGGIETHCQELYTRLVQMGCDVTIVTRTPYVPIEQRKGTYEGISLKHIYAPKKKSLEAVVHTFLAILYARFSGADIVHIHAIGPALLTPFARMLGLHTVLTHHGPDYDRQKWGALAKKVLRLGEAAGARFADKIIVISRVIARILETKHGRKDTHLIYNGVPIPIPSTSTDYLDELGITKGKYVIAVGRFVEEKGFHDLIEAWQSLRITSYHLVLVGDADHETAYSQKLKHTAKSAGTILTGFIKGRKLSQIFTHARLFVMPSYHEGLPIALLEAMSYNLPVLVSDIPANLEVPLDEMDFFSTGNVTELAHALKKKLAQGTCPEYTDLLQERYNWDSVAKATYALYQKLLQQ
ncbi:MAG: glycosyltransferase family 4 protein [Sedimenticola sp.]